MFIRNEKHWEIEDYKQRTTTRGWRYMLLHYEDTVTFEGKVRQLKAKNLGAGVVELSKVPLEAKETVDDILKPAREVWNNKGLYTKNDDSIEYYKHWMNLFEKAIKETLEMGGKK
jgi:hypothetical protein